MREELRVWVNEGGDGVRIQSSTKCHDVQFEHFRDVLQELLRLGPKARKSFNGTVMLI